MAFYRVYPFRHVSQNSNPVLGAGIEPATSNFQIGAATI